MNPEWNECKETEERLARLKPAPLPDALRDQLLQSVDESPREPRVEAKKIVRLFPARIARGASLAALFVLAAFVAWLALRPAPATVEAVAAKSRMTPLPEEAATNTAALPGMPEGVPEMLKDEFVPVSARRVIFNSEPAGWAGSPETGYARQHDLHFIETVNWKNPKRGATLESSIPRRVGILIPDEGI